MSNESISTGNSYVFQVHSRISKLESEVVRLKSKEYIYLKSYNRPKTFVLFRGKTINSSDEPIGFYGSPTSCEELRKLGRY